MLVFRVRSSLFQFERGLATSNNRSISYVIYPKSPMEARQIPFMHPSRLEAHSTPRHQSGDHVPCNRPSTRQHSLKPATAPGSLAVPCSEYTHAHETKGEKKKKGPGKQKTAGKVRQGIKEGGFEVEALRGQRCTNRARSGIEI